MKAVFYSLLLALPCVLWPLAEWASPQRESELFLPYLNHMDVAYHLTKATRLAADAGNSDYCLWEHRHAPGDPHLLIMPWLMGIAWAIRLTGTVSVFWVIGWILHAAWIYATHRLVRGWVGDGFAVWPVVSLFVYGCFYIGINVFFFKWDLGRWMLFFVYENFRAYPSVAAMLTNTLAIWRLYVADQDPSRRNFVWAALCVGCTPYARPFDWTIIMTFVGLQTFYWFVRRRETGWRWLWGLGGCVAASLPFLVTYLVWRIQGTGAYDAQLPRQMLQGRDWLHFVKYAGFGLGLSLLVWLWLKGCGGFARAGRVAQDVPRFFLGLMGASFLAYGQYAPGGKTINSYQYFLSYFSVPFAWLAFLIGLGMVFRKRLENASAGMGVVAALLLGICAQLCFAFTPGTTFLEMERPRSCRAIYRHLKDSGREAVVLSMGTAQELVLEADAWMFVPYPMSFSGRSMAPTTELLERQFMAKLILTGKISDLAPLFDRRGLPKFEEFLHSGDDERTFWTDRLLHCPGGPYFVFDPVKGLMDIKVRNAKPPPELLARGESFAWFCDRDGEVFDRMRSLEGKSMGEQIDFVRRRYRLTHLLLTPATRRFAGRMRSCPEKVRCVMETADGSSLWEFLE